VQLALETISRSAVYLSSFTPITNIGASLLGADITTFLAPPCITPHTHLKNLEANHDITFGTKNEGNPLFESQKLLLTKPKIAWF